ncbi:unnamed protein product, partial [Sphacelaria rigidula]
LGRATEAFVVSPTTGLTRHATTSIATSPLRMSEGDADADAEPSGPTAADISKGIAHPAAVFTVPENILKVLPHRYPFALVDKVLHFEAGKRIVGVKCITNNEPQFTGHFPDLPIMPGVLQVRGIWRMGRIL